MHDINLLGKRNLVALQLLGGLGGTDVLVDRLILFFFDLGTLAFKIPVQSLSDVAALR